VREQNIKELLELAIEHEGSAAAVARRIGYSPATISVVRADKYDAGIKKFYTRLRKEYEHLIAGQVMCPGLKSEIHTQVCRKYREAVREGKILKGSAFAIVKEMCPFCPIGGEK
jgi:hypothetical protein